MTKKQTIIKNQSGIASMVIVILIMTLLSLIVVSMTKNANREQRQALDRQLNSQAFYAAESGVNDAKEYYFNPVIALDLSKQEKNTCNGASADEQLPGYNSIVGANNNRYSCVLYDATPDSLEYNEVKTEESTVVKLESNDPAASINSLTFKWRKKDLDNTVFSSCPAVGQFPPSLENCDAGVLRIELINPVAANRDDMISSSFLAFISPGTSPTGGIFSTAIGANNQGATWQGACVNDGDCSFTITGINGTKLLHMRSIYMANKVSITANGGTVQFKGAQLRVDSTGRAEDVLKRIQVHIPFNDPARIYPEFALQTTDAICKRLQILPPGLSPPEPTQNDCAD